MSKIMKPDRTIVKAIEQSSIGGVFVINFTQNTFESDKTWNEIKTAMEHGKLCIAVLDFVDTIDVLYASNAHTTSGSEEGETNYIITFFKGVVGSQGAVTGAFVKAMSDSPNKPIVFQID